MQSTTTQILRGCCRWLDIFNAFPSLSGSLPVEVFLQLVPLLHARYYSIASSHWAVPNQVGTSPQLSHPPLSYLSVLQSQPFI